MANEKRNLIDRDDLIDSLGVSDMEIFAKEVIGDAPTVNAVEVVRCKYCRHWREGYGMQGTCQHFDDETDDDSFCSYGERKDNG